MAQQQLFPPQHQDRQPGLEAVMNPRPQAEDPHYQGTDQLAGKVALITGGDSGIGRAVAIAFAKEGADISIVYFDEHEDAQATRTRVEELGRRCLTLPGDVGDEPFCYEAVRRTVNDLGQLDILVNNAAVQFVKQGIEEISAEQLERIFRTNIFGYFFMTKAALPHLQPGSAIINTTSVEAYRPSPALMDYACTQAAIVNFTRSLAEELIQRGIRVNAVAPGPVWTPLIPASFPAQQVARFGMSTPMKRPAQPYEIAPAYVFLASGAESSYMTGQVIHEDAGMFPVS